ncbi:hypothetical protein BGZ57DRAFT_884226, partial [Hyaloscypha finlandica]
MGLGATIGPMSAESYPIAVREMGYSVSAGFGKAGAAIGKSSPYSGSCRKSSHL